LLIALLLFTYFFFDYIDHLPTGITLDDWVLREFPAKDVSPLIVFFESSAIILLITRSITNPDIFITYLIAVIFILMSRIVAIDITRLSPPIGLIELKDPFADIVYKSGFIKRDLFYSGHASILFLIYLCLHKKTDRYYVLFAAISVCFLLLIQHVHYTVDIISAPFFSTGCFLLSKRLLRFKQSIINK
jgi:hypothetical protein